MSPNLQFEGAFEAILSISKFDPKGPHLTFVYDAIKVNKIIKRVQSQVSMVRPSSFRFFRQNRKPNRLCINDGFIFGFLKKAQASQDELLVRYLLRLSIKNKFVRSEASL